MKKSVVSINWRGGALTGTQVCVCEQQAHVYSRIYEEMGESQRDRNRGPFWVLTEAVEWVTLGIAGIVQSTEVASGMLLRVWELRDS